MASHERETTLLPSESFQDHDVFSEDNNNINNIMVSPKGLRSFESKFSTYGSSYSSWSDFSSPLGSELESTSESTESEDEEFISELTRQMAEYMLQDDDDDDEENQDQHENSENSEASELSVNWSASKSSSVCCYNTQEFMNKSDNPTLEKLEFKTRNYSDEQVSTDEQSRTVQVYQLKNQPQMRNQGSGYGARRVKGTESTQPQNMQNKGKARYGHLGQTKKNSIPHLPSPQGGSGMRAVFLGGSERNGSSGTGVFLPSGTYKTPEPKRKSGCSTVLIPARVLQTLQQHFNTVGATSPSSSSAATTNLPWQNDVLARINGLLSQEKKHAEFQTRPASPAAETNLHQEVHLPQEWTY